LTDQVLRQRNRIVTVLIALGMPCIVMVWLYEAWAGLLTETARYYYPLLLVVLAVSSIAIRTAPVYRRYAEWFAFALLASYFIVSLGAFALFPSQITIYNVANIIQ
jgi:cytochrome bd-type quinol oxidase subunit 2